MDISLLTGATQQLATKPTPKDSGTNVRNGEGDVQSFDLGVEGSSTNSQGDGEEVPKQPNAVGAEDASGGNTNAESGAASPAPEDQKLLQERANLVKATLAAQNISAAAQSSQVTQTGNMEAKKEATSRNPSIAPANPGSGAPVVTTQESKPEPETVNSDSARPNVEKRAIAPGLSAQVTEESVETKSVEAKVDKIDRQQTANAALKTPEASSNAPSSETALRNRNDQAARSPQSTTGSNNASEAQAPKSDQIQVIRVAREEPREAKAPIQPIATPDASTPRSGRTPPDIQVQQTREVAEQASSTREAVNADRAEGQARQSAAASEAAVEEIKLPNKPQGENRIELPPNKSLVTSKEPAASQNANTERAAAATLTASGTPPSSQPVARITTMPVQPLAHVERDLATQIVSAASTRGNSGVVNVTLDPPELGRVEIVMEIADQGLRATLTAERQSTGDMIRRHMDLLAEQFEDAGFDDLDLNFGGQESTGSDQTENLGATMGATAEAQSVSPSNAVLRETRLIPSQGQIDVRL